MRKLRCVERIWEYILTLALRKMAEAVRKEDQGRFNDPLIGRDVVSLYRKVWGAVSEYDPYTIARVPTPSEIWDLLEDKQVEVPAVWEESLEGIDFDWLDDSQI